MRGGAAERIDGRLRLAVGAVVDLLAGAGRIGHGRQAAGGRVLVAPHRSARLVALDRPALAVVDEGAPSPERRDRGDDDTRGVALEPRDVAVGVGRGDEVAVGVEVEPQAHAVRIDDLAHEPVLAPSAGSRRPRRRSARRGCARRLRSGAGSSRRSRRRPRGRDPRSSCVNVNSTPVGSTRRLRFSRSSHSCTVTAPLRSVTATGLPQLSYAKETRVSSPTISDSSRPAASWMKTLVGPSFSSLATVTWPGR